jgi:hypothetical protein
MKDIKHTPGAWIFMTDDTFYGEIRDADNFTLIAVMPELDDRPEDFTLIAAAPDLLAACEEMVAYIYKRAEEWDRVHGKGNFFENINDAESTLVDVMRTAIAKAKGDQP